MLKTSLFKVRHPLNRKKKRCSDFISFTKEANEVNKIELSNRNHIESELTKLLKKVNEGEDFFELLTEDSASDALFKHLYKNEYLKTHYSIDFMVNLLDLTYRYNEKANSTSYLDAFLSNIEQSYNDWIFLVSLDYNRSIPFPLKFFKDDFDLGKFTLTPSKSNSLQFCNYFEQKFSLNSVKQERVDDENRRNENILEHPLLTFTIHGARDIVKSRAVEYFKYFKMIQDVYFAVYDRLLTRPVDIQPTTGFFLINAKNGDLERYPLWEGSQIKGVFSSDKINEFIKNDFISNLNLIFTENNSLFNRIYNAAHFFSKGLNEGDRVSKFLFYVIAMEALYSKDKHSPIRATLSDYISLMCYPPKQRFEIHKKVRDIYDARSSIVHTGKTFVQISLIEDAEKIAAKAIMQALKWYTDLKSESKPDEAYFNKLLKLKLK